MDSHGWDWWLIHTGTNGYNMHGWCQPTTSAWVLTLNGSILMPLRRLCLWRSPPFGATLLSLLWYKLHEQTAQRHLSSSTKLSITPPEGPCPNNSSDKSSSYVCSCSKRGTTDLVFFLKVWDSKKRDLTCRNLMTSQVPMLWLLQVTSQRGAEDLLFPKRCKRCASGNSFVDFFDSKTVLLIVAGELMGSHWNSMNFMPEKYDRLTGKESWERKY